LCFSIGGTAAVGYHVVTGRPPVVSPPAARDDRSVAWYSAWVLAPLPAFGAALLLTGEMIWAGVAGFLAGVLGRLICRPDLAAKTGGGLLFLAYQPVAKGAWSPRALALSRKEALGPLTRAASVAGQALPANDRRGAAVVSRRRGCPWGCGDECP
jgi:hypothetical protein